MDIASAQKAIDSMLSESPDAAHSREHATFASLLKETDRTVVLFGAGRLGRLCARALRRGGVPLRAFCDRNPSLRGTTVEGAEVLGPEEAVARFGSSALFVVSIWTGTAKESMVERLRYLHGLGCRFTASHAPLVWAHARDELPFHSFELPSDTLRHAPALRELASSLSDETSLRTLEAVLRQRLLGDYGAAPPAPDQYFPGDVVRLRPDEIFVDGGAFTGDTMEEFIRRTGGKFAGYHAFEPDPANFGLLRGRVAALSPDTRARIVLHQAALCRSDGPVAFSGHGDPTSKIAPGASARVEGRALDSALSGRPFTFLKLDVEGGENDALLGARAALVRCQPSVAACVYHHPRDLWEIPALLRSLLPTHRRFLRQHQFDGYELVLYALPRDSP